MFIALQSNKYHQFPRYQPWFIVVTSYGKVSISPPFLCNYFLLEFFTNETFHIKNEQLFHGKLLDILPNYEHE